jgi:hypothetical protein
MEAALTASALVGPVTNGSMNPLGILGIAAAAAMVAFVVVLRVGIDAPMGQALPA